MSKKPINYKYLENKFRHIAKSAGYKFHSMKVEIFHVKVESEDAVARERAKLIVQLDSNGCVNANQSKLDIALYRADLWLEKKYDGYVVLNVDCFCDGY